MFSSLKSSPSYLIITYHSNGKEIIWFWAGQSGTGSWMDSHLGYFLWSNFSTKRPESILIIDWGQNALPWQLGRSSEMIPFCTFCKINMQALNVHLHPHHEQITFICLMLHAFSQAICIAFSFLRRALWWMYRAWTGSETGVRSKEDGQENIWLVRNEILGSFWFIAIIVLGGLVQFSSTSKKYFDLGLLEV